VVHLDAFQLFDGVITSREVCFFAFFLLSFFSSLSSLSFFLFLLLFLSFSSRLLFSSSSFRSLNIFIAGSFLWRPQSQRQPTIITITNKQTTSKETGIRKQCEGVVWAVFFYRPYCGLPLSLSLSLSLFFFFFFVFFVFFFYFLLPHKGLVGEFDQLLRSTNRHNICQREI